MVDVIQEHRFYHIKNLQSTKTQRKKCVRMPGFITLRIYKVLKLQKLRLQHYQVLSH